MGSLFQSLAQSAFRWYSKSEELIEDEMEFAIPNSVVNNLIKQWITDRVAVFDDLHSEINDDWLRIFATLRYRSVETQLCCDAKIIAFEFNKDAQFIIFEQISRTRVLYFSADRFLDAMLFKSGFWLSRNVLRQDPLGKILKRLNIATLDHGLIRIDIQPYIAENYRVLGALEKIQINQAFCKHRKLVLRTNVNLYAVLGLQQSQRLFSANKQSNPA